MAVMFVVVLVVCAQLAGASLPLPSYMKACCVDHPNYFECCRQMGQLALKSAEYKQGDPEYGLEPIDPLKIDFMTSKTGGLNLNMTDAKIYGVSNAVVIKAHAIREPGNKRLETELLMPKVSMASGYSVNGKIMVLNIRGTGDAKVDLENVTIVATVALKDKLIEGKNHVRLGRITGSIKPSKMRIRLQNLFNGNTFLGEQMNTFINENWREMLPVMDPFFKTLITKAAKSVLEGLSRNVAEEDIFPHENCATV